MKVCVEKVGCQKKELVVMPGIPSQMISESSANGANSALQTVAH